MNNSSLYNKLYNINQERLTKITVENIRAGVNIFGTVGNYTSDSNATTLDIANGKTAYVNGVKLSGILKEYDTTNSLPIYNISMDITNSNMNAKFLDRVYINGSWRYITSGIIRNEANIAIPYNLITSTLGISPTDIKKDVQVFDITGTYDASTEFHGIKMDPVTASNTAISLTNSISEISGLDTTNGTNMFGYFANLKGLVSVSNLDLSNVKSIDSLFAEDTKLSTIKYINMYNSDTPTVPASLLFSNCSSLTEISDTVLMPKTINYARYMFHNCQNLININTVINISATSCEQLFNNCFNLESLNNVHFIAPSGGITAANMFCNCKKMNFETLNLTGCNLYDTSNIFANSNVCNASVIENLFMNLSAIRLRDSMFAYSNIDRVPNIRLFRNKLITPAQGTYYLDSMFRYCNNLTEAEFDASDLTWFNSLRYMFQGCPNLTTVNMSLNNNWKVVNHFNAYNLYDTFNNCTNLTSVNIICNNSTFFFYNTFGNCRNLVNVTMPTNMYIANASLYRVFYNCANITNLDDFLDMVTTRNDVSLQETFYGCSNLVYDKEINYDISSLGYLSGTFVQCSNITNNLSVNVHVTTNSSVFNLSSICGGAGFNSLKFDINYTNMINSYYGSTVYGFASGMNNLKNISMDIYLNSVQQNPYRGVGFQQLAASCPNLTDADINFTLYNDFHRAWMDNHFIINCPNLTNLNVNIIYGKVNNTTIATTGYPYSNVPYIISDCNKITSFNLNMSIASNIMNISIARSCPNLTDINCNITFEDGSTGVTNAQFFRNCPNLSDTLIDNFLGILRNISPYRGTKSLSMVFTNCNISNIRYESMNNYAGLIANGWTL